MNKRNGVGNIIVNKSSSTQGLSQGLHIYTNDKKKFQDYKGIIEDNKGIIDKVFGKCIFFTRKKSQSLKTGEPMALLGITMDLISHNLLKNLQFSRHIFMAKIIQALLIKRGKNMYDLVFKQQRIFMINCLCKGHMRQFNQNYFRQQK